MQILEAWIRGKCCDQVHSVLKHSRIPAEVRVLTSDLDSHFETKQHLDVTDTYVLKICSSFRTSSIYISKVVNQISTM